MRDEQVRGMRAASKASILEDWPLGCGGGVAGVGDLTRMSRGYTSSVLGGIAPVGAGLCAITVDSTTANEAIISR